MNPVTKITETMYSNAKKALPALMNAYLSKESKAGIDLCKEIIKSYEKNNSKRRGKQ